MARAKVSNSLDKPENFQLGELGYSGLSLFSGITQSELNSELNFPNSIRTFKQMQQHPSVNACLSLYDNLISKVNWRVIPPKNATEKEKKQAQFVSECLDDMDVSFKQVIRDALTSNTFGFAVLEKVYRRRNKQSGSLYDDNKVGIKKIALRNQESILRFIFDDLGNEVVGVKQQIQNTGRNAARAGLEVNLPRSKFILVTTGKNRNDPYGKSPLRDVYMAWRYLEVLQELEAQGVAKDLQGVPLLTVPAQLMSADASPEQKANFENLKNIVRNLQTNSQSGVILPSAVDEMTRTPLYDLKLLSSEGGKKNYDTSVIKEYYQNQIYTGLFADVLILGQGGGGSFALGQIKNSLTGSAAEAMLDNIVEAFNRDLIRQLYELNGWNPARAARLDYENLSGIDLDNLGKFIQRLASTSMLPMTLEVVNNNLRAIGLDSLPEDTNLEEIMPNFTSRSGDGMATAGAGTSTDPTNVASGDGNLENAA